MQQKRIIISAGGTGGHIFPALAVAGEIKERFPDLEILFVGALGKMEMEKVPAAGFKIVGLPVMGFPRKPGLKWFKFLKMLMQSNKRAKQIIKEFKPDLAAGFGGFASGPVLRIAAKKGIPAIIQEQNSYAGITNKLLSKKVKKICVSYENMERFFPKEKLVFTGNPVRKNLTGKLPGKDISSEFFNLNKKDKVILIIGGSLGARSINNAVLNNLEKIRKSDVKIIWQTGAIYYDEMVQKTKKNKPSNLFIHKFLQQMDMAYDVADIIISRAGAGTISELCLVGKPVILVPSPNVAEDHQTKNAKALESQNAAILINDKDIHDQLFDEAFVLIGNEERLKDLSENIKKLAKPDATKRIVEEMIGLIK
ncbi:MAG: undecaprenyldiphospho-muramoylpentapeptide beta-N-acetylglucosaminyltransferase [Prolixibacteraceae bacterium]|nr:undecaprenyldiphospho-muramoylpentapeptide beta-N-acetylglucosaminyltransferase [Prolixibacteraceae bacterium]MBN2773744.1 undecaprenyldiphospho-muramoylpentapeptide beta-N-acetylglucosaminyltransferase [Prolixibacteraceae bacterium]